MEPQSRQVSRKVAITGIGLVTPLATGAREAWEALCAGRSGVGPITTFDPSGLETRIAAEVTDFRPQDFLSSKDTRRTERFIAFAVAAARMALEDARLSINASNCDRVGVSIGCGLGGLSTLEKTARLIDVQGPRRVSPFFIPMIIGNMAPGMISIYFGAKGPNLAVGTACAAGAHAVGSAFRLIQGGQAEVMIAGGVEAVITPTCIAGFNAMKVLSVRNDAPEKASRPFDRDRDGFVVGEGCGIMILEELESALARGASVYAEIIGFGMSGDGYHMVAPDPQGEGAARCMQAALDDAGLGRDKVDYINAHGTATELNDHCETLAIKKVFGEKAAAIPISATKSMTGHLLGGAGGMETVFTALSLYSNTLPPTINLDTPAAGCDLDYIPHSARKQKIKTALTNSFGFGGTNACLALKRYP